MNEENGDERENFVEIVLKVGTVISLLFYHQNGRIE